MPRFIVWLNESSATTQNLSEIMFISSREAGKAFYGTTCDSRRAAEQECFTAQSCGSSGKPVQELDPLNRGPDEIVLIAVSNNRPAGFLAAKPRSSGWFIFNLCVVHEFRGDGVAGQLLAALSKLLPRKSIFELTVHVPTDWHDRASLDVKHVAIERFPKLLSTYAKMNFKIVDVQTGGMIKMRSSHMRTHHLVSHVSAV